MEDVKANLNNEKREQEIVKVIGTPSALLLPARNFKFKVYKNYHIISIPRKGVYSEIDPEFFAGKDPGNFHVMKENVLYLPTISRILFACKKYPDLDENQAFVIIGLRFFDEEIQVIGSLIEFLEVVEEV